MPSGNICTVTASLLPPPLQNNLSFPVMKELVAPMFISEQRAAMRSLLSWFNRFLKFEGMRPLRCGESVRLGSVLINGTVMLLFGKGPLQKDIFDIPLSL